MSEEYEQAVLQVKIERAHCTMAGPLRPYCTDKAVSVDFAEGCGALIVACDGVSAGNETSAQAAEIVANMLETGVQSFSKIPSITKAQKFMRSAIWEARKKIRQLKRETRNLSADTTLTAGMVCQKQNKLFLMIAHVGDTRMYRVRLDPGKVEQLTEDHTKAQELVVAGKIFPEEAPNHPDRNLVSKLVGFLTSRREIDWQVVEIQPGDIFLAVSDGFSDNVDTAQGKMLAVVQAIFAEEGQEMDVNKLAKGLVQKAREAGRKSDDICVSVLLINA